MSNNNKKETKVKKWKLAPLSPHGPSWGECFL
jgi:hypothetical protein